MISNEQSNIIQYMSSNESDDKIVTINAVSGSGKSSVSKWVIDELKPKNGIYTAFNKAIVTDSSIRFKDSNIEAKTLHALAYKYIRPNKGIEVFSYSSIKEDISYFDKKDIIDTIDEFCRSKEIDISIYSKDSNNKELINKYFNLIYIEQIPMTFNCLLKKFHILLNSNKIKLEYDMVILDECADLTEVTLEIFKLINSRKKLVLGDKYQNIYGFMNTVNAFDLLENTIEFKLTTSFRCSKHIAEIVEDYGITYLDKNFKFTGTDNIDNNNTVAYLSAYNSSGLLSASKLINNKTSFSLLKDTKELFSLPLALYNVKKGNPVYEKRFNYLEKEWNKWNKLDTNISFDSYLMDLGIKEVKSCLSLLRYFEDNNINLFELRNILHNHPTNKNKIISTIHAYKGLEADTIIINNDIKEALEECIIEERINKYRTKDMQQLFNLYYVGLTRAKHNIIYDKI